MKLLIDTNVILDFLLKRENFYESAKSVLELSSECDYIECVSASAVTDIYYITKKRLGNEQTQQSIENLLEIVDILKVTNEDIKAALDLKWSDFEDAVQYAVALHNDVDFIISRNARDYEDSTIPVYMPEDFINLIEEIQEELE